MTVRVVPYRLTNTRATYNGHDVKHKGYPTQHAILQDTHKSEILAAALPTRGWAATTKTHWMRCMISCDVGGIFCSKYLLHCDGLGLKHAAAPAMHHAKRPAGQSSSAAQRSHKPGQSSGSDCPGAGPLAAAGDAFGLDGHGATWPLHPDGVCQLLGLTGSCCLLAGSCCPLAESHCLLHEIGCPSGAGCLRLAASYNLKLADCQDTLQYSA